MPLAIEDYALIGDCESAALVGRNGSIDWLCWPRFDSDAVFAALLGSEQNGRWLLAPRDADRYRITRRYRPNTLILETRFESDAGTVVLIDFMTPRDKASDIIRVAQCERGCVAMRMELILRFGYGSVVPWVSRVDQHTIQAVAGPDMVLLRSDVEMHGEDLSTVSEFKLQQGESMSFSLTYQLSHLPLPSSPEVATSLQETEAFWREWIEPCLARGNCPEPVVRSLILLRSLIYAPTGGIVASPTTSLPEQLGGERNWDYRFCWLRDATLTLLALMNAGFYEEASAWRAWLVRAIAGSATQMQILYGVSGERRLTEWEVPWLPGYQGAKPVRIGNAAHAQLQLDVFGEVMDALYQARRGGVDGDGVSWALQCKLLSHLAQIWREPDSGLWEMRGPQQHFTYSKVMTWVAFDRGVKSIEQFGVEGPVEQWRALRQCIYDDVCQHGYDTELNSFVQAYGSRQLDASLLLLAPVGFVAASDSRYVGTVAAIERRLLKGGFVLRYDTATTMDGLPPGEGAFIACSFWLVDAYAVMGRMDDAKRLFERLCGLCNDVGLLAEEYDPSTGRLTGNFPQAFSHIALIGSAHNLFHQDKPVEQRSQDTQVGARSTTAAQ
jgi:GH15 family glucan-1,4-alpha-glucosidase